MSTTTFDLKRPDLFPEATSVGAYPASSFYTAELPPAGAPRPSAAATATVTSGVAAFTGLTANTTYFFAASVSGTWRYVKGRTDVSSQSSVVVPTGVAATDQAALVAAIASGKVVDLVPTVIGSATLVVSGDVELTSRTVIRGPGQDAFTIKLADGANKDVFKGTGVDSLAGGSSNGGVYGLRLSGFTIDGNKANQTSGAGRGLAVYGYANQYEDIRITGCRGLGVFHDWGNTAAIGSDLLAVGHMECTTTRFRVDRCDGGGIDWQGPSDSQFANGGCAKNGPATGTTTFGMRVTRNAVNPQIINWHNWGSQHQKAFVFDVAVEGTNIEGEGASYCQMHLRVSGNKLVNLDLYPAGTTGDPYGLVIGDSGASLFSGDNHIRGGRLRNCGVLFDKDGGNNVFDFSAYWPDATKTIFTGTPRATVGSRFNVKLNPDAAVGAGGPPLMGSRGALAEIVKIDQGEPFGINHPSGTLGASILDACLVDTNLTSILTGSASNAPERLVRIPCKPGQVITAIEWMSGTTAGAGLTHMWTVLRDTSWNKLAISADDTAATWATDTPKSFTLTTPFTVPPGVYVLYAGLVVVGTTVPTLSGHQFLVPGRTTQTPICTTNSTGVYTDPASVATTVTPNVGSSKIPYVRTT